MLTGLLFAIEEAIDDPARLVATLPFLGTTLIEHQARQLVSAGAAHIVVIGERQSPELLGALHRMGRGGVPVDAVHGAAEAAATLHPLARVVMLADGLVTTDAVVRSLAGEGGDTLLVVAADGAPPGLERIGGASAWAGAARLNARRLVEVAKLPADYDPQSTLIRIAEAAGATRVPLPPAALRDGHGIERDPLSLAQASRRIVAAAMSTRRGWFDRVLAAPLARAVMPALLARGTDTVVTAGSFALAAIVAAAALATGWLRVGMSLAVVAMLAAALGVAVAELRDQPRLRRAISLGALGSAAIAMLVLGWRCSVAAADGAALSIAVALVAVSALIERTGVEPSIWWAGAAPCMMVVAGMTLFGWPVVGLALAAGYALVTLTAAINALRSG